MRMYIYMCVYYIILLVLYTYYTYMIYIMYMNSMRERFLFWFKLCDEVLLAHPTEV